MLSKFAPKYHANLFAMICASLFETDFYYLGQMTITFKKIDKMLSLS